MDVVKILTDQPDHRRAAKYWSVLKTHMKKEGGGAVSKKEAKNKRQALESARRLLYEENHSLGEWFKRSLMAMM